jgi:general secretion pathway protein N
MRAVIRVIALAVFMVAAFGSTSEAQTTRAPSAAPNAPGMPRAAMQGRPQAPQPKRQAQPDADSGVPPLDELNATRDRPLFSSTRRPPEVAAPEPAPVTEAKQLSFELVGIVSGPDASIAILRNTETKEETRVPKGEKFANWTIDEIGDRFIVMSGDGKRIRMRLFNESKAPGIKVLQVGAASGPAVEAADDDEKVDVEVEPSSSPEARPAAASPQSPQARRDRRARRELQRQRQRARPNRNNDDE